MKKLLIALSGTIAVLLAIVALAPVTSTMAQGPGNGGGRGNGDQNETRPGPNGGQQGNQDDAYPAPGNGQNGGQQGNRPGPNRGGPRVNPIDVLAEELDMTRDEIIAELADGMSIAEFAEAHNVALGTIVDTMVTDMEARLAQAVENGRMTQDEADERLANARENITARLQEPWQPKDGPRDGDRGPRGGNPHDEIIAEQLGMTTDELREALQDGETTVADLAAEKNVALDTIVDAIVADIEARLAQAVENGRMTQDEADERLANARENITARLQEPCPQPPQQPDRPNDKGNNKGNNRP